MNLLDQLTCYLAGVLLLLAVISLFLWLWQKKPSQKSYSQPATSTPTSASPATAPASAYSPKGRNWLWWLAVIALLAGLGWWGYKNLPPVASASPQIRQLSQERIPQKYKAVVKLAEERSIGLTLVGKVPPLGDTHFVITNGGKALLFADIALRISGTAYFKSYMSRDYPGAVCLEANGLTFSEFHKGGGRAGIIFKFPSQSLSPGKNTFVLSSPGDNVFVEKMEIEIQY